MFIASGSGAGAVASRERNEPQNENKGFVPEVATALMKDAPRLAVNRLITVLTMLPAAEK